jgi:hypothetical protein
VSREAKARWIRGAERAGDRDRDAFDPAIEGGRYRLARELSLTLWDRICVAATDAAGRLDVEQARRRFHALAARIATRGGLLEPGAGRLTRVGVEIDGDARGAGDLIDLAPRVPGRETRVMAEARSRRSMDDAAAAGASRGVALHDEVASASAGRAGAGVAASHDLP